MKIEDLKQGFAKRVNSHLNNLKDLLSDASQKGDHREVARLFHESVVTERVLDGLEGKSEDSKNVEVILYPVDTKSTPSIEVVSTRDEISLLVGGELELAKHNANSLSVIVNGELQKTAIKYKRASRNNPYLPPYRGNVVMVPEGWEKLPAK